MRFIKGKARAIQQEKESEIEKAGFGAVLHEGPGGGVWWEMSFHIEKVTHSEEQWSKPEAVCSRKSKELWVAQKWGWAVRLFPAVPFAYLKAEFSPCPGVNQTQLWAQPSLSCPQ